MKALKTLELVVGLIGMLGAVCCGLLVMGASSPALAALLCVAAVVQGFVGMNRVMESLFGDHGLVCELFGRIGDDDE